MKYLKLNEKSNLEVYTAFHSEILKMKDKSVRWTKHGRSSKIQTTLWECMAILEEKDELINYVVWVIKNERPLSGGDITLYRVFKSSKWYQ